MLPADMMSSDDSPIALVAYGAVGIDSASVLRRTGSASQRFRASHLGGARAHPHASRFVGADSIAVNHGTTST